jgi:hypothetical protein
MRLHCIGAMGALESGGTFPSRKIPIFILQHLFNVPKIQKTPRGGEKNHSTN